MSGTIRVDTTIVRNTASELARINGDIDNEFNSVNNAMQRLAASWDGDASNRAMSAYNRIKNEFCGSSGARHQVMNNYVNFLNGTVANDYDNTEINNQKLASLFK